MNLLNVNVDADVKTCVSCHDDDVHGDDDDDNDNDNDKTFGKMIAISKIKPPPFPLLPLTHQKSSITFPLQHESVGSPASDLTVLRLDLDPLAVLRDCFAAFSSRG